MNPFNPLSIVQSTFESDDVQHELKELVEIIRAYDIYDFLRRLSALNLQKRIKIAQFYWMHCKAPFYIMMKPITHLLQK